jgi:hypothetical protein
LAGAARHSESKDQNMSGTGPDQQARSRFSAQFRPFRPFLPVDRARDGAGGQLDARLGQMGRSEFRGLSSAVAAADWSSCSTSSSVRSSSIVMRRPKGPRARAKS